MVDLANPAQVLNLLAECGEITDKLTSNELEILSQIKAKYNASDEGTFDDKICLEVMLRNVGIRETYNMNKNEATRIINFEARKKSE